jgi:hypothetical protein
MHVLRIALLVLAVVVGIGLVLGYVRTSRPKDETPEPVAAPVAVDERQVTLDEIAAARQRIETRLGGALEYAQLVDRMKTRFPTDYEAFLSDAARRSATSGVEPDVDILVFEAVRTVRVTRGVLAAKAGAATLDHFFEAQRTMLRALALEDSRLCVDFLYGGVGPGFFRFSAQNRASVARFALAGLDAIVDGRAERIDRDAPSRADLEALEGGLVAKGLQTEEIEAVLDAKTTDPPIADESLCRAGRIYLDVLADLPEPSRMRLYGFAVELMAR